MSKAFTKDEGEDASEPVARPLGPPLPPGSKNYVTPAGALALRARLQEAHAELERARAAGGPALAGAQDRVGFWTERLRASEEVQPPKEPDDLVRFGATVLAEDGQRRERRFHIVGIDEADALRGEVSWTSPVARALLGRRVGEEVVVPTPQGPVSLEIVSISY